MFNKKTTSLIVASIIPFYCNAIDINLTNSFSSIQSRDQISLKRVSIKDYGIFDVIFKWNPVTLSMDVVSAIPSTTAELTIGGATSISENNSTQLTATLKLSDGTQRVISPQWSINSGSSATINSSGTLLASSVNTATAVTVTATYIYDGLELKATKIIQVNDTVPLPTLSISGTSSVNEGESINMTATLVLPDGTQQSITPIWTIPAGSPASIDASGLLTASQVTANKSFTLAASFNYQGTTIKGSYLVTIKNKTIPPRTCSGTVVDDYSGKLTVNMTVNPETSIIDVVVNSVGGGTPYFFDSRLSLVQGVNSINFGKYEYEIDGDTAAFAGLNGWSGYGTIPSGTYKQAQMFRFPSQINLSNPFVITYTDYPVATISCP